MIKKRLITAKDLLALKFVRSVAISLDEKEILYVLEWMDETDNKYYSNLWMISADGKNHRQFTFGKVKDSSPIWSADGSQIAFVSKRGEKSGIYLIARDGGEAKKLIEEEGAFKDLSWSPDGKSLAYSFRKAEIHKNKEGKSVQPVVRHITRLWYRYDGDGWLPKDGFHIWVLNTETEKTKQITRGKYEEHWPSFSPDGKQIAFISNRSKDPDFDILSQDLWLISPAGGKERKITTPRGPKEAPSWSPDGKRIAYLGHTKYQDAWGVTNYHLWVVEPNKKGSAVDLVPKLDRMCMDMTITDTGDVHSVAKPAWSGDGKEIYFNVSDSGNTHLYKIQFFSRKISKIISGSLRVSDFHINGNTTRVASIIANPTNPGEVFIQGLKNGKSVRLTELNSKFFREVDIQVPEETSYKSFDGSLVDAWILKPANFNPDKKYPAVVQIHGGPRAQYGNAFFHEFQLLAAQGYVVFYTNPRGSQGYGEKFAGDIVNDWGNKDYKDIMVGVDFLCSKKYVNSRRMGVTGGSYGGYMTNWIVGHTNRFKAAITGRSVVNLISFFGSSDMGYTDWSEFGGHPWENFEGYVKMSPITYARNIRTPLLIIHNENDLRCNIEQAEQLFAALKVLKRKVEFVRFPEEFHGLSRTGRPDRRIERLNWIVNWFKRYLKR